MDAIYQLELTFCCFQLSGMVPSKGAWASKQDQEFIFCNAQTPQLIIKTGVYSEKAFIQGNMVLFLHHIKKIIHSMYEMQHLALVLHKEHILIFIILHNCIKNYCKCFI